MGYPEVTMPSVHGVTNCTIKKEPYLKKMVRNFVSNTGTKSVMSRSKKMLFQMHLCRGWDNVMLSLAIMNVMASVNYALALVLALVSLVTSSGLVTACVKESQHSILPILLVGPCLPVLRFDRPA